MADSMKAMHQNCHLSMIINDFTITLSGYTPVGPETASIPATVTVVCT